MSIEGAVTFIVERRSADAFVFCTSDYCSEGLFARWNRAEGLDACYEITDIPGFARAVSAVVASSARYAGTFKVLYRNENIDYRQELAGLTPATTKFMTYAWQQEARSIWEPFHPTPPLRPWVIEAPAAVALCRPVAFYENASVRWLVSE